MSYTQGGEEAAILGAVAGMADGSILDIGAAHPITFSNSRALIEKGWHATLVEASPDHFMTLYEEYKKHPNVDLILAAVDIEWDLVRLHHTTDLVSTIVDAHFEKWRGSADFDGEFSLLTIPICELYNRCLPIDVLSIDTEGTSAALCHSFFDSTQLAWPKVICVEHDSDRTLETRAAERGYRTIYLDGNNLVLAK